jgi:alkylated DNA repair dioxygenase AlkB
MGKCHTGYHVRNVRALTPKVEPLNKPKDTSGRAKKRKKYNKNNAKKNSSNFQGTDKYGVFDVSDKHSPINFLKAGEEKRDNKLNRSHHQDTEGKVFSKELKKERVAKNQLINNNNNVEENFENEYSSDDQSNSNDYDSSESSSSEDDLANYVTLTENDQNVYKYSQNQLGFSLENSFLNENEQNELFTLIEKGEWVNDYEGKRVQVYGYNFLIEGCRQTNNNSSSSNNNNNNDNNNSNNDNDNDNSSDSNSIPIPTYFDSLRKKIENLGYGSFDQLLISEYLPSMKDTIPHVDRFIWGDKIVGISLGGSSRLILSSIITENDQVITELNSGSLYSLTGRSRYEYAHALDNFCEKRISLTFRSMSTKKVLLTQNIIDSLVIS